MPVLGKKSFPVRALEIGPRGPADSGRPSLSAPCRLTGPGVQCPRHLLASSGPRLPRRAPLTLNPSPLSSDMFSFPCDSSWLPRHHFASFSSHRTRLVERIPRLSALVPKESVIAPFIWGSTGTQATRAHENRGSVWMGRLADDRGGGWGGAARGRGKLAPGSRPADTPSGTIAFAGAFGLSSWSPPYSLRRVRSHWESNGVYGKRMDPSLDPLRRTSKRVVVET